MAYAYSTNMKYAVCFPSTSILNFTQFSQNRLWTMKYCSGEDCNSTPSCENVILHTVKESWILIVTWKTNSPFKYFQEITPDYCNIQIDLWKWSTYPVQLVKDYRTSSLDGFIIFIYCGHFLSEKKQKNYYSSSEMYIDRIIKPQW